MPSTEYKWQDRIVLPGWTTTPVAGAPKLAGESWEDRDSLTWSITSKCWRKTSTPEIGLAFADGPADAGDSTAAVRVRPVLAAPPMGRRSFNATTYSWLIGGVLAWLPKVVGVAITAGATVYRVGNPDHPSYGLATPFVSGLSANMSSIGAAAQDAAADATLVPVRLNVGLSVIPGGVPSLPDDEQVLPRAETTAISSGAPILQDRTDPTLATSSVTSGGAGKVLLGLAVTSHATGATRVAVGNVANQWGDAMSAWMAATVRLGAALLVTVDADDEADVARWCGNLGGEWADGDVVGFSPTIVVDYQESYAWDEEEGTLTTSNEYALRIAPIHAYSGAVSGTYERTGHDVPDIAIEFPYDQLEHCDVPPNQVIVYQPTTLFDSGFEAFEAAVFAAPDSVPGSSVTAQPEQRRRPRTWVHHSGLGARVRAETGATFADRRWGRPLSVSVFLWSVVYGEHPEYRVQPYRRRSDLSLEAVGDPFPAVGVYDEPEGVGFPSRRLVARVDDPDWVHPASRDLVYVIQANDGSGWADSYYSTDTRVVTSGIRRKPYPWRVARVVLPGGLGIGLEGALYDQPTVWPAPTINASGISVAVSTFGVETQLVWSGSVAASIPSTPERTTPQMGTLWLSIYHPALRRWLRGSLPGNVWWAPEQQRHAYFAPLTVRLRNQGPEPVTLQWRLEGSCRVARQEYDIEGEYPIVIRGTVVVPPT